MPEMTAEQAGCLHEQFACNVGVHRLTQTEGGPVTGFTADVQIECSMCGLPFRFLGCKQGSSPFEPMTNADDTELRAPIAPGRGQIGQRQRFVMPVPQPSHHDGPFNPEVIAQPASSPGMFRVYLPEKKAEMTGDMSEERANLFCNSLKIALAAGESLDEAIATAGKILRDE